MSVSPCGGAIALFLAAQFSGAAPFELTALSGGNFEDTVLKSTAPWVVVALRPVCDASAATARMMEHGFGRVRGRASLGVLTCGPDPVVRRCRLPLSKPVVKSPMVSALEAITR